MMFEASLRTCRQVRRIAVVVVRSIREKSHGIAYDAAMKEKERRSIRTGIRSYNMRRIPLGSERSGNELEVVIVVFVEG
jgi:hypothetical protein